MAITLDGTTGIASVDGSATSPSVRGADSNSGIVYAADEVKISTGGTERLEVDSSGNIDIPDNGKIRLGTGNDLSLYHTGSVSHIEDNVTNVLRISADSIGLQSGDKAEAGLAYTKNGSVDLYYDGVKKFFTYSEGVKADGYIKAHPNMSDSHWGDNTHNWNFLGNNVNSSSVLIFEHSGDTAPYGIEVVFTDNTPDNNSNWFYYAADLSAARFRVYSDGDVWTSDSGILSSDETLKENIVDASPKLEDLKKLKVRNFNWKSSFHPEKSKQKQLGFIAQEVEEVFPALITEHDIASGSPDNSHTPVMKKAIKQAWSPIIIKAMQELIAKVETLETKVAALEAG